ncbi:hypothetical protein E2562_003923 [Oryza meyeriana var. granulata]|uniref:Uncharacterized protein n=1 Tax=Oryza meyeriana var. granulata TaxID=110450 RepID=A0A6G1CZ13_9ORYZ|nr:hypothetical protein E2562_003923 [Oryza meyeriana var. granulata]
MGLDMSGQSTESETEWIISNQLDRTQTNVHVRMHGTINQAGITRRLTPPIAAMASPSPLDLGALVSGAIAATGKKLRAFLDDDYGMYESALLALDVANRVKRPSCCRLSACRSTPCEKDGDPFMRRSMWLTNA